MSMLSQPSLLSPRGGHRCACPAGSFPVESASRSVAPGPCEWLPRRPRRLWRPLPCRQSSHPACHRPDECRDIFGDRCGPWRVPSDLCGPVIQGGAVSNNVALRTFKVKYPANRTAQPYGKTLRQNPTAQSGETRGGRINATATNKTLRLASGCPTQSTACAAYSQPNNC